MDDLAATLERWRWPRAVEENGDDDGEGGALMLLGHNVNRLRRGGAPPSILEVAARSLHDQAAGTLRADTLVIARALHVIRPSALHVPESYPKAVQHGRASASATWPRLTPLRSEKTRTMRSRTSERQRGSGSRLGGTRSPICGAICWSSQTSESSVTRGVQQRCKPSQTPRPRELFARSLSFSSGQARTDLSASQFCRSLPFGPSHGSCWHSTCRSTPPVIWTSTSVHFRSWLEATALLAIRGHRSHKQPIFWPLARAFAENDPVATRRSHGGASRR